MIIELSDLRAKRATNINQELRNIKIVFQQKFKIVLDIYWSVHCTRYKEDRRYNVGVPVSVMNHANKLPAYLLLTGLSLSAISSLDSPSEFWLLFDLSVQFLIDDV